MYNVYIKRLEFRLCIRLRKIHKKLIYIFIYLIIRLYKCRLTLRCTIIFMIWRRAAISSTIYFPTNLNQEIIINQMTACRASIQNMIDSFVLSSLYSLYLYTSISLYLYYLICGWRFGNSKLFGLPKTVKGYNLNLLIMLRLWP